jgi:hypothetical protein
MYGIILQSGEYPKPDTSGFKRINILQEAEIKRKVKRKTWFITNKTTVL